jgi:uncharacterized protein (TIGR02145 family)
MLPAAGLRLNADGQLFNRGISSYYWSSTEDGTDKAWNMYFYSGGNDTYNNFRRNGMSIRCIAEDAPPAAGSIGALNCGSAIPTGTLTAGSAASGVSASVPYTGGNGGTHSGQTVTSTGVTGLTATLAAGSFANGAGNLSYAISGTPSGAGTASFALNIGGQSCTLALTVGAATTPVCRAKINATDYKDFMCHNLGAANTSADPFTPSWEIIGGYWQWGRKGPNSTQWLNTNTPNFAHGPTGSGAGETNQAAVSGWDQTYAPSGAWLDASKTADDPCPPGFRVPTKDQWNGVRNEANNPQTVIGTWTSSPTNYSSGMKFGPDLMLPATGYRTSYDGGLLVRGETGIYWSSTVDGTSNAWMLSVSNGGTDSYSDERLYGQSLRCIAE